MSLKKKLNTLLEAYPGYGKNRESEAPSQGSSQKASTQTLEKGTGGGKTVNHSSAPLAAGAGAFEAKPMKQGDSKDAEVQDLGKDEPGNKAYQKGKGKAGLTARGAGKAPNFKTVANPTEVINKKSSEGNVHQEETETDEELVETEEELTAEEIEALDEEKKKKDAEDDEDDDDDDEDDDEKKEAKEKFAKVKKEELERDVNNLFSGEIDLTEEFKSKAASLFEAAVTARVAHEVSLVEDAVAEKAVEIIAENEMRLVEKLDAYLSLVAEEWLEQNKVEVTNVLRTEIAENFMESLHNCFAENYINVPDEKYDLIGEMQESFDAIVAERDEILQDATEMAEELLTLKRGAVITQVTEGLAKTQVEKFNSLVEEVTYEDDESFAEKLEMVKKNLFSESTNSSASTDAIILEEDGSVSDVSDAKDPEIEALNERLSGKVRF